MRSIRLALAAVRGRICRLGGDPAGTAAVEFALILPLMVVLYFGCVEISQAVSVNRKVTAVSSATGDLVAQATDVDDAELADILDAAAAIIAPYPVGPLQIVISGIFVEDDGSATVQWSEQRNATARSVDSSVTIPDGLQVPDTCLVMAEVDYEYSSPFSDLLTGAIQLSETFYLRPRKNDCVIKL